MGQHYTKDNAVREEYGGAWIPAIPLPLFTHHWFKSKFQCACAETFDSLEEYQLHYRSEQLADMTREVAGERQEQNGVIQVLGEALALACEDLSKGCQPAFNGKKAKTLHQLITHYRTTAGNMTQQKRLARRLGVDEKRVDELHEARRT